MKAKLSWVRVAGGGGTKGYTRRVRSAFGRLVKLGQLCMQTDMPWSFFPTANVCRARDRARQTAEREHHF